MRSINFITVVFSLVLLVSLVAASSGKGPHYRQYGSIVKRQDDDENTETSEPTKTKDSDKTTATEIEESTGTITESAETATDTEDSTKKGTKKGTKTGTITGTKTEKKDDKTTKSAKFTPTSINPVLPAGGIQMVTPDVFAPTTYVKIGNDATFAWNYTSLIVTPTAVDVVAYCSKLDRYFTISSNMTVEETGSATWNTGDETDSVPLVNALYTLMVYDPEIGPTERASAGYLGNTNQFVFGAYAKRPYTPLSESKCATCNSAAISSTERQALAFMFGMVAITVCSFTWFASGLGLFA